MIDRIGGGKRVDVDLGGGQFTADAGERAGTVTEENRQLRRRLDRDMRIHREKDARPRGC